MRYPVLFLALALVSVLGGCGVANVVRTAEWGAELSRYPDAGCVKDAVAQPGLTVDYRGKPTDGRFYLAAPEQEMHFAIHQPASGIGLALHIIAPRKGVVDFTLEYDDPPRLRGETDALAHGVIAAIATRCGAPELLERVKLHRGGELKPRMPNI